MDTINRLNPIIEVLRSSPQRVNRIYVQRDRTQKKIAEVIRLAREGEVALAFVPREKLDSLSLGHQGAVAVLSPKAYVSLDSLLSRKSLPFIVLLDEIEDPQNLGAIIRVAEAAGVDGLVLPERRSAGLTDTVFRVSAGAAEHLKVARVKNMAQAMEYLKRKGIWLVGAEGGRDEYWDVFDYKLPLGLVFGSEAKGLRPVIQKKCDKILSIPMQGQVNSLNVASAASVFIFEVIRQRKLLKSNE